MAPEKRRSGAIIPDALTKRLVAQLFDKKVDREGLEAIYAGCDAFFDQVMTDVTVFAQHAERTEVTVEDIKLLLHRQRKITAQQSYEHLIRRELSNDDAESLLDV